MYGLVQYGMHQSTAAESIFKRTKGIGICPAHRNTPIAAFPLIDSKNAIIHAAYCEAGLTHYHKLSRMSAAAINIVCRALIIGKTFEEGLEEARKMVSDLPKLLSALGSKKLTEAHLDAGGFAPEVVKAAVHFVQSTNSFQEAIEKSLKFAGPANYCPVLVGAIAGSMYSSSMIKPEDYDFASNKLVKRVEDCSDKLAALWN